MVFCYSCNAVCRTSMFLQRKPAFPAYLTCQGANLPLSKGFTFLWREGPPIILQVVTSKNVHWDEQRLFAASSFFQINSVSFRFPQVASLFYWQNCKIDQSWKRVIPSSFWSKVIIEINNNINNCSNDHSSIPFSGNIINHFYWLVETTRVSFSKRDN